MPALIPGTRLGPYEILDAIGAGGMGEVYRGRDTRLDRTVAVVGRGGAARSHNGDSVTLGTPLMLPIVTCSSSSGTPSSRTRPARSPSSTASRIMPRSSPSRARAIASARPNSPRRSGGDPRDPRGRPPSTTRPDFYVSSRSATRDQPRWARERCATSVDLEHTIEVGQPAATAPNSMREEVAVRSVRITNRVSSALHQ